jgi:hypothetical protein
MISALAGVTIVTPDVGATADIYQRWLGYRPRFSLIGKDMAENWGLPALAGAPMATLLPESGEKRFIRLITGHPAPDFRPLCSYGWAAAELIVEDVDRLAEKLQGGPFRIIGPPADLDFTDQIRAMQVLGPAGEVLYLTQIKGRIEGFDLPRPGSFVGQLFIMVLAAPEITEAAGFYGQAGPALAAKISCLSNALDLPADHLHRLTTVALGQQSLIEVDELPADLFSRPLSSVGLPSGIAMVSLFGDEPGLRRGAAGEWIEILPSQDKI